MLLHFKIWLQNVYKVSVVDRDSGGESGHPLWKNCKKLIKSCEKVIKKILLTFYRIYLNGDGTGKGKYISLFFVIMRSQYDALLPWPFNQKVTLMLLDQGSTEEHVVDAFRPNPNSSSFKRPVSDMNIASGCPLFVPLNLLESNRSYVKDDTAFVKIIVDTQGLQE